MKITAVITDRDTVKATLVGVGLLIETDYGRGLPDTNSSVVEEVEYVPFDDGWAKPVS